MYRFYKSQILRITCCCWWKRCGTSRTVCPTFKSNSVAFEFACIRFRQYWLYSSRIHKENEIILLLGQSCISQSPVVVARRNELRKMFWYKNTKQNTIKTKHKKIGAIKDCFCFLFSLGKTSLLVNLSR